MINNSVVVGRLTRDPELRKTSTGKSVTNFTVACNRNFGDKDQADFINCVAWNHTADFLANYMNKGALVGIVGRIQSRTYEDKTGNTVFVQEVVAEQVQALESKSQRENNNNNYNNNNNANDYNDSDENALDITSDDLPF